MTDAMRGLLLELREEVLQARCQLAHLQVEVDRLRVQTTTITTKEETLMVQFSDFQSLLVGMDEETTRLGTKLQELLDKLAAGGMTAAEEQAVFDQASAVAARLKVLGTDPAEPIPPA